MCKGTNKFPVSPDLTTLALASDGVPLPPTSLFETPSVDSSPSILNFVSIIPYHLNADKNDNSMRHIKSIENTNNTDFGSSRLFSRSSSTCSELQLKSGGGSGIIFPPGSPQQDSGPSIHFELDGDGDVIGRNEGEDGEGMGLSFSEGVAVLSWAMWYFMYGWTTRVIIWLDPWAFMCA